MPAQRIPNPARRTESSPLPVPSTVAVPISGPVNSLVGTDSVRGDSRTVHTGRAGGTKTASSLSYLPVPFPTAPGRSTSAPAVDLPELTVAELSVIFYAADYRRTFTELVEGPDLIRMAAVAADTVARLGLDLIRQVASLIEYAELHYDWPLLGQVCPDRARRNSTFTVARLLRCSYTVQPAAMIVAGLAARWHTAIESGVSAEAVA